MLRLLLIVIVTALMPAAFAAEKAGVLTPESVNAADLSAWSAKGGAGKKAGKPNPAIAKLEILLDRAGASPGVIDGFDGENFRKALAAYAEMTGGDGGAAMAGKLDDGQPVMTSYTITDKDVSDLSADIPSDYAEMAKLKFLGYTSVAEELAERFHMDEDLLKALNPGASFAAGETVAVADVGADKKAKVTRLEADKSKAQLLGYDDSGKLVVAYPATIGSKDNPSPTGTHKVDGIAPMPNYTYDPSINFQQGDNTEKLIIPPGPNGPVGSMWIDLTEPTFGIHGTPEPSKIDKTNSHGCIRLTNWDAAELATLIEKGVPVTFVD